MIPHNAAMSDTITLESDWQKQYSQPVITQYFMSNKSEIWAQPLGVHSKR